MYEVKRYEAKYNFYGCVALLVALLVLILAIVAFMVFAMHYTADYTRTRATVETARIVTDGSVAVARLQAQEHITTACMQYSWFTSMKACIYAGGVNSAENKFISWAPWLLLAGAVIWWRVKQ